jgi:DNA-binding transcriptional LysR family regulator
VSTGATGGVEQVPRVLRAFRQARPQVQLDLRQIIWEDHSGGLNDGSVDAAFVWLPFEHEGLAFEVLVQEPRVAALEAAHPLTAHEVLRMEQLVDEPWPWVDADRRALDFWTCVDHRGGVAARRGPTISSMEGILEGVRAGLCVATIPRSHAQVSAWPGIAFRPVADLTPAALALGWRIADETPVVQALVEIARRVGADDAGAAADSSEPSD